MNTSFEEISRIIETVTQMSRKTSDSTGEINASLSEIGFVMNEASNSMENQVNLVDKLEKSVERFTLMKN
jgi:methyl-accepting chemotaxis protein